VESPCQKKRELKLCKKKILLKIKVCQLLAAGLWFSPGTPVSTTNKTYHHNITEILLKVGLNTLTLTLLKVFIVKHMFLPINVM